MATTSITQKFQKVTVSGTGNHELSFASLISEKRKSFDVLIKWVSGTAVQISNKVIDSDSGTLSTGNDKIIFFCSKQSIIHFKGGAGSEVFTVNIC